jgi:D-alanyl-D-alanine carboxypeptidase (penicillin-binding protein 5/6)
VSERAWRTGGSRMFLDVGTRVSVENLIRGIIIQSGNDACVVVAEALGGTVEGFAAMMNARARQLGLDQSHFVNPDGLCPNRPAR